MNMQEITLHCDDGATNQLTLHQVTDTTSGAASAPIILIVPAMAVPASKYQLLARTFNDYGIDAATIDLRGVGNSSIRASREHDFSYQTIIDQELNAAINVLQQQLPQSDIYLLGHSLGGQLSALYASEHQHNIKGIVLAASCSVYYKGWPFPTSIGILLFSQIASLAGRLLGHFPGRKFGFGGREARTLMQEWATNARTGKYKLKHSTNNYAELLTKVTLPILAVNYAEDTFAPIAATDNLVNMLSGAQIQRAVLSGKDLGIKKAQHINWLKCPEPMVKLVAESFLPKPE